MLQELVTAHTGLCESHALLRADDFSRESVSELLQSLFSSLSVVLGVEDDTDVLFAVLVHDE